MAACGNATGGLWRDHEEPSEREKVRRPRPAEPAACRRPRTTEREETEREKVTQFSHADVTMAKTAALSLCLAVASAFQGPAPARPASQLAASPNNPYQNALGAQAPAGFWDPIGISDNISPEQFQRYREVEQKHGRIAMIATIGYVVPEKFGTFGDIKLGGDVKFSDVPNGVQALFKIPAVGLLQILLLIGILETQFPNVNGDYGTGYFGQSLEEPLKSRKLAIELANGRLAMLAIMGLLAQDVVTGGHPLAGPNFGEGGFVSL